MPKSVSVPQLSVTTPMMVTKEDEETTLATSITDVESGDKLDAVILELQQLRAVTAVGLDTDSGQRTLPNRPSPRAQTT